MILYKIVKNLKHLPLILYRVLTTSFYKDVPTAIQLAEPADLFRFLFYRILKRPAVMALRKGMGEREINAVCEHFQQKVSCVNESMYLWECNQVQCYGTYEHFLGLLGEYFAGAFEDIYSYDWKDKIVVDVGGYVGDSALYFFENGAKQIHIFEPISINVEALKLNLQKYQSRYEVHQMAVADRSGTIAISSNTPEGGLGYGLSEGQYTVHCQATTFSDILTSTPSIDVMKVDCEGGEKHLHFVENALIQSVPYWIIETHSSAIYSDILNKFLECGFNLMQDFSIATNIHLLHFEKREKSSLA